MLETIKRWSIQRPDEDLVNDLVRQLGIPAIHAKILVARGIVDSRQAAPFLQMTASSLHDPFLLFNMDKAVQRILQAIENDEQITVYGDYDADGVTSVAVLTTALERLGAQVDYVIPNRFVHGYGPNESLLGEVADRNTKLLITVDNGIAAIEPLAYAKARGMDVIVTDHHEIGEQLPKVEAIIHPRHPNGEYPFGELAGVGVAFKLATALLGEPPFDLLELVAIGTVADLVPLVDENRYIVKEGIARLRKTKRPGLQALLQVAAVAPSSITEESIGFVIGPRINAAGRLGEATPAVELLLTENGAEAARFAQYVDELNKERQALVKQITVEAEERMHQLYGEELPKVLVIEGEGWNAGVVGIVASRLTEKYYRPAIVLSVELDKGIAKGSARSIEGFDLYQELSKNASLLTHYGGHQMAAGLTLPIDEVASLRRALERQAEQILSTEKLTPKIQIDVPLQLTEIDLQIVEQLEQLRPFGVGFEKPLYLIEDVKPRVMKKIGAKQDHLKLELHNEDEILDAIGFGMGHLADQLTQDVTLSIVGDLQINEWNGHKKPQLLIEDMGTKEWQLFDLRGIREPSRWLPLIPTSNTVFLYFQERHFTRLQEVFEAERLMHYSQFQEEDADFVVLLDLPSDWQQIEELFSHCMPKRIYAHFYTNAPVYFEGIPDRSHFGWFYTFLKQRGHFNVHTHGEQLAKHKGWTIEMIHFMSKVFFELDFVMIKDGLISMNQRDGKKSLTEAPSYQQRLQQMELEKRLLFAPQHELKQWLQSLRNEMADREEQEAWI